ncbi:predicted protein [Sclerotinia sclerotiorum 1980 UF-70]|uniref:Uncharacterized protein n=1 Tax=Sclerotinia sclerotiorum (strain ATCC 18683 / 1980 / Ss-1) TaxID=665079 RepID=A7F529_SCLS1|nr:predicted protein [Sclerotinia sclerotiorum 1980 UF-70]EDN97850.1 predicted protein [Sclerotinia sclerotiorum 1980 UF-70]
MCVSVEFLLLKQDKSVKPMIIIDESSILQDFFASRVYSNNCAAFKAIFDQRQYLQWRKIQVADYLGRYNTDYARMDQKGI